MLRMKSERGQGHFDRWAPRYDRSIHQKLMFGPVHDVVLSAFSKFGAVPRDVLDVGCGTGRLLESAGQRWIGARLTGIDVSEAMVAEARRKHEGDARFTLRQGDASDLPLKDASFDVVFSTMSFHHWGDQASGVREVARVLRPGGLFVLADVSAPLLFLLRPLFNWGGRASFQGPQTIRRLMQQASLSILMQRRFWRLSRVQLYVARKN
jgi:ubiquinone/menaquinone biosynthesis C-methylase UbiE